MNATTSKARWTSKPTEIGSYLFDSTLQEATIISFEGGGLILVADQLMTFADFGGAMWFGPLAD